MSTEELDDLRFDYDEEQSGFGMAIILGLVLALMIGAFIWFVVQFDPLTEDFIDNNAPVATATPDAGDL